MRRIQIATPKVQGEHSRHQPLPVDPRDPDIVRVKALARAASTHLAAHHRR